MSEPCPNIAAVALNTPLRREFDYRVPGELLAAVAVGSRVRVPFGKRGQMIGVVVRLSDRSECASLKDIVALVDSKPLFDPRTLELARWMADYYACSWGEALGALLPAGTGDEAAGRSATLVQAARPADALRQHAAAIEGRARVQARVLRILADTQGEMSLRALCSQAKADGKAVAALRRDDWVSFRSEPVHSDPFRDEKVEPAASPKPTPDQQAALDRIVPLIDAQRFQVALLHGVTGSGKTEVYLQALRRVVEQGRQGIVLVPEISLTPQTVRRFRARFDRVAVLHSGLTDAERRSQWRHIRAGKADVVIGARSAVFAPVPCLGLVVVDEEHENSFKQDSTPRYHARDVGIWRARQENAFVLLGSATPSLESHHNSLTGKYLHIDLPRRVEGRPLPPVEVVNLREAWAEAKRGVLISRRLRKAVETALERGEQVIMFLNRRGFATSLLCPGCGFVLRCRHCDVALTYHQTIELARCHYCLYEVRPPDRCPTCGRPGFKQKGVGTQRAEDVLADLFPEHVVARMDSDSMRGRGRHGKTLDAFRRGEVHILLGTQMIAKGLDFPNVTVVGVLNADMSLNLPDFRAAERTFQLLAQVAGRAGRGDKGGRVFIQTFTPEHDCVAAAAAHDFDGFAETELRQRREFAYPPYTRLARVLCEATKPEQAQECASAAADRMRAAAVGKGVVVLGPAPTAIPRLRGKHRWHVCLKAPDSRQLHDVLAALDGLEARRVQVTVDVDPVSLL